MTIQTSQSTLRDTDTQGCAWKIRAKVNCVFSQFSYESTISTLFLYYYWPCISFADKSKRWSDDASDHENRPRKRRRTNNRMHNGRSSRVSNSHVAVLFTIAVFSKVSPRNSSCQSASRPSRSLAVKLLTAGSSPFCSFVGSDIRRRGRLRSSRGYAVLVLNPMVALRQLFLSVGELVATSTRSFDFPFMMLVLASRVVVVDETKTKEVHEVLSSN